MFYTCLPIPSSWPVDFRWIARWVPCVGLIIGGLLALVDEALVLLQVPYLVASGLVVALWLALTGGLHMDGVMDVADGLAVPDPQRRLAVMADSRMGAFGGMAAVVVIVLKILSLAAMGQFRWFAIVAACAWGRWAQQWAIAYYPYLKKEGKGAQHKAALPSIWYTVPNAALLCGLSLCLGLTAIVSWSLVLRASVCGWAIACLVSAYFHRQLGGHTGDTYGAVVEWTEVLLLCCLSAGQPGL